MLLLGRQVDFAVSDVVRPLDIAEAFHALQRNEDALQPVSEFHRHRVERHATHLLKIGELRDFLPV